ncbi:carnitinyl-CoA dehydratase [Plectosphaerella plurivora]|uniref:Carnitinyl-CoA dehydratase n=1 Tax=Plectosphaerella plurivora TaxID=936078 RepID=A0A9P8VED0_9PEZI|nr:carnitinyl-CoA dehydratase [Plectosphaerella plurivora]
MAVLSTQTPPPPTPEFLDLSLPKPHVLLIRMNRPKALNALSVSALREMDAVLRWFESEITLLVAVLTGTGRAFCAGADLKHWRRTLTGESTELFSDLESLSRRTGVKPIIAAINGLALGGGFEFAVNCDLVVAAESAVFGLPEVKRGIAPNGGVLSRLVSTVGMQIASEIVLTGRQISAREMHGWGLVNQVVSSNQLVDAALRLAELITPNSPDGVICARAGLRQAWKTADVDEATNIWLRDHFAKLEKGHNAKEGLSAFVEKRAPQWKWGKSLL